MLGVVSSSPLMVKKGGLLGKKGSAWSSEAVSSSEVMSKTARDLKGDEDLLVRGVRVLRRSRKAGMVTASCSCSADSISSVPS